MRLFIAVEIPEEIRKKLFSMREKISEEAAKIKWVEENNIHMTLKFLGEVDENKVDGIKEALSSVNLEPFECSVKGFGVFPNRDYVRVIWAGLEPEEPFRKLHEEVDISLESLGFGKDSKFSPHVTIGRVRFVKDKEGLRKSLDALEGAETGGSFEVQGFVLKKSTLTEKGPVYEDMGVFGGK
jgi:2'-5' RNA ligase